MNDSIKEHLAWLDGKMPSEKIIEKDFSEAPIYHFCNKKETISMLSRLDLNQTPKKRKVLLDELSRILKFIKGS